MRQHLVNFVAGAFVQGRDFGSGKGACENKCPKGRRMLATLYCVKNRRA